MTESRNKPRNCDLDADKTDKQYFRSDLISLHFFRLNESLSNIKKNVTNTYITFKIL